VLFAQGRDLSGQRPDETNAVCRRAGNEAVVPTVRHSVYGCVLPVHALKVPFLPRDINLTIAPWRLTGGRKRSWRPSVCSRWLAIPFFPIRPGGLVSTKPICRPLIRYHCFSRNLLSPSTTTYLGAWANRYVRPLLLSTSSSWRWKLNDISHWHVLSE